MAKLNLEKYYTQEDVAKRLIEKTYEIIGQENITEVIEPSAGAGAFSLQIPNCRAFDIAPEHESIRQMDFLNNDLDYKKGRLIIGNPPFRLNKKANTYKQFIRESIRIGDYIAFILPLSQYNNRFEHNGFELIYSEDLGSLDFSGVPVHTCFNIYKRPEQPIVKNNYELSDVEVIKVEHNKLKKAEKEIPEILDDDILICGWGFDVGEICTSVTDRARVFVIRVHNKVLFDDIKHLILNIREHEEYFTKNHQGHIYNLTAKRIRALIQENVKGVK